MAETIYISRRCEYCHELLILLHKNILKYPVVDVDTKEYPRIVKSVPCMIIKNKILPGVELFKFLEYLIDAKTGKQTPEPKKQELLPGDNNGMIPGQMGHPSQMRNLNQPPMIITNYIKNQMIRMNLIYLVFVLVDLVN